MNLRVISPPFSAVQGSNSSIPLFIKLPGIETVQFLLAEGLYVGQVIKAIIVEFKLDTAPQQLQLFKLEGSSRTQLDPTQTLAEAGIHTGTRLGVELKAAVAGTSLLYCRLSRSENAGAGAWLEKR